jgi:DNA-binding transcriptional ArsR family regulator
MRKRRQDPALPEVLPSRSTDQEKLAKAAAHPLRARALSVMVDRPASPKEIASIVGKSVPHVSYHFKELVKAGLIELVEEKKRRGAVEHFYKCSVSTLIDDEDWAKLSQDDRLVMTTLILHLIIGDSGRAMEAGRLIRPSDEHLTRTPMFVDEEGWSELKKIFRTALEATLEVSAKSSRREAAGIPQTKPIRAALMLFEMPPD